jgi:hypothetical protein
MSILNLFLQIINEDLHNDRPIRTDDVDCKNCKGHPEEGQIATHSGLGL